MNKLLTTLIVASFTFAASSAFAADQSNTEDAKDGLVQDQTMEYKMMDTNTDGMISKKEYMKHHENAYGKMKQTNGSVSLKDMNAGTKGNKIQPNSVKDAPPEASK